MMNSLPPSGPGVLAQELDMHQWREQISRSFAPLDLKAQDEEQFRASLVEVPLGEVHLFDMVTDAHSVLRPERLISSSAPDFCKLSLQLEGSCTLVQDGRRCELQPGDLALYVTQRPYELHYPARQHSLVVQFPQSFVHLGAEQVSQITATPVSQAQGLGKVAVPLFEQLARNMDELDGPHAASLVRSALDLLVTVLGAESHAVEDNPLLHQAMAYIDDHLGEPELAPSDIAHHLYVSLRQLHARFAQADLSVAACIRHRRLERIRQELADPLHGREPVHTISARYGLLDPSHVSKAFKAEFGESPSAFRARVLAPDGLASQDGFTGAPR